MGERERERGLGGPPGWWIPKWVFVIDLKGHNIMKLILERGKAFFFTLLEFFFQTFLTFFSNYISDVGQWIV